MASFWRSMATEDDKDDDKSWSPSGATNSGGRGGGTARNLFEFTQKQESEPTLFKSVSDDGPRFSQATTASARSTSGQGGDPLASTPRDRSPQTRPATQTPVAEAVGWTPKNVVNVVKALFPDANVAETVSAKFRRSNIDGGAFLLLTKHDLINDLGIDFGSAVKIANLISQIARVQPSGESSSGGTRQKRPYAKTGKFTKESRFRNLLADIARGPQRRKRNESPRDRDDDGGDFSQGGTKRGRARAQSQQSDTPGCSQNSFVDDVELEDGDAGSDVSSVGNGTPGSGNLELSGGGQTPKKSNSNERGRVQEVVLDGDTSLGHAAVLEKELEAAHLKLVEQFEKLEELQGDYERVISEKQLLGSKCDMLEKEKVEMSDELGRVNELLERKEQELKGLKEFVGRVAQQLTRKVDEGTA